MKAEDKPKYVIESRELLASLDLKKLISNANDLTYIAKINRLIAIFTNFSFNDVTNCSYTKLFLKLF